MKPELFTFITALLREHSGLSLTEDKTYLLESRLQPIARQHGFDSVEEMLDGLAHELEESVLHDTIQAMTTNETMFFRDNKPYERLAKMVLPQLLEQQPDRNPIRIWSAACSTGQEPYTIALCLKPELAKHSNLRLEITGSDLCHNAVEKAKKAVYTQFEVQRGMPIQLLVQYFNQQEGNQWQLKDEIRQQVNFFEHNLLHDASRFGQFDIIFCRNVLIYFDEEVKRQVMKRLLSVLRKPGYLVLGSAETVMGITDELKMLEGAPGVYTYKD